jgi:hypothetical protein
MRCEVASIKRATSFGTQHCRQFLGFFGINQIVQGQVVPLQDLLVEKMQSRDVHLDAACGVLLLVEQVELVAAYLFSPKFSWRLAEILSELLDSMDITASSLWGIVALRAMSPNVCAVSVFYLDWFLGSRSLLITGVL